MQQSFQEQLQKSEEDDIHKQFNDYKSERENLENEEPQQPQTTFDDNMIIKKDIKS